MLKVFIFIALALWTVAVDAQEITEKAYLEQDSLLWADYENQYEGFEKCWEEMPAKRDSIQKAFNLLEKNTDRKNIELAIQYASVPSGLRRVFMVRQSLTKDTLSSIIKTLDKNMKRSFYGKNIRAHIRTEQIAEGDKINEFKCISQDGKTFRWKETRGKQLLILYGGMSCMGDTGRQYLKQLRETVSRDDFMILIYWPCDTQEELAEAKSRYPGDYVFISDFKGDGSPMKIEYGSQAMPTCFLTDKEHVVVVKCTGVHPELFDKYFAR